MDGHNYKEAGLFLYLVVKQTKTSKNLHLKKYVSKYFLLEKKMHAA